MSRCSVCKHPERGAIEDSITLGWSLRLVAERFGVSSSALSRHHRNHQNARAEERAELARLRREKAEREHEAAACVVFGRWAGWRGQLGDRFERICYALAEQEDYTTLAGWMRAFGCSESGVWEAISAELKERGAPAGEVFAALYEPDSAGGEAGEDGQP